MRIVGSRETGFFTHANYTWRCDNRPGAIFHQHLDDGIFCLAAIVKIYRGIGNWNGMVSSSRKSKFCGNRVAIILSAKNQCRIYRNGIVDDGIDLDIEPSCLAEFPMYPVELVGHFDTGFEWRIDACK